MCPSRRPWCSWPAACETATTKHRSNSSSSGVLARCSSSGSRGPIGRRHGTEGVAVNSAVLGVGVLLGGLPLGRRVPTRGEAAGVLQEFGHVHQVPRHEGGVAVGEVVLG